MAVSGTWRQFFTMTNIFSVRCLISFIVYFQFFRRPIPQYGSVCGRDKADFADVWPNLIKLHSQQRTCGELSNHKFYPFAALLLPTRFLTLYCISNVPKKAHHTYFGPCMPLEGFSLFCQPSKEKSVIFCSFHSIFTPSNLVLDLS